MMQESKSCVLPLDERPVFCYNTLCRNFLIKRETSSLKISLGLCYVLLNVIKIRFFALKLHKRSIDYCIVILVALVNEIMHSTLPPFRTHFLWVLILCKTGRTNTMYKMNDILFCFSFSIDGIEPSSKIGIFLAISVTSRTAFWAIWFAWIFHFDFLAFHFAISLSSKSISFCSLNSPQIKKVATKISQMVCIKNDADIVRSFLSFHFGNVAV